MKKLYTTTALVLALGFALSGCGGSENVTNEDNETPTIKMFANFNPADPGASDKAFIADIEEATGVKLEFDIPPSTSYSERQQLMLAGGDYPDAILFLDTNDKGYLNAVDQGIVIPVNDYLTEELAPNILKYSYDISWDALKTKNDDNIYGIPRSSMVRNDGFMIREDWLERLGIPMPEDHAVTVEEFAEICRRFSEEDPDGNGKKDTYGVVCYTNTDKTMEPLFPSAFGCLGWQEDPHNPGSYIDPQYDKSSESYKEALSYTADLFTKKYIDPNSPSNTSTDAVDKFIKGTESGIISGFSGHLYNYERDLKKNIPDAKLNYIYIKNKDGEVKGGSYSTGFWGHWCITSSCKNPEAVVKVLDYILSDEGWNRMLYGKEGIDYTMEGDKRKPIEDCGNSWSSFFMRRAGDFDFFVNTVNMDDSVKERLRPIVQIGVDTNVFSLDNGFIPEVSTSVSFINYQTTMNETITKIVTGNIPVSSYDSALDGWYTNGGEQYVEEMNTHIKKMNE